MKIITLFFFLSLFANYSFCRENLEIGTFVGTSYYMGNINRNTSFYSSSPAFGALVRYNINHHYTLRAGFSYGQVKADDLDFENILHQTRSASFINNFYDFSAQTEFSFLPFRFTRYEKPLSTYVTAGISYTLMAGPDTELINFANIPFGVGVKYGLNQKVTIGLEWILKKCFSDSVDGVKSFGQFETTSLVHNNDWVSLAGFFITIKPFERKGDCPAYTQ